jgi:transposase-like protein
VLAQSCVRHFPGVLAVVTAENAGKLGKGATNAAPLLGGPDVEVGRRLNNRAENSHQPFRQRERAMQRFRSLRTLQNFSSVHAEVHNHFNQERHLVTHQVYKQSRAGALAEWRALAA